MDADPILAAYICQNPVVDERQILSGLKAIGRRYGGSVDNFHWPAVPMTFGWARLSRWKDERWLLFTLDGTMLAVSSADPATFIVNFIDDAELSAAVATAGAGFRFLTASALNRDLDDRDRSFLAGAGEGLARDLRYWKPRTVGDIIFNRWD